MFENYCPLLTLTFKMNINVVLALLSILLLFEFNEVAPKNIVVWQGVGTHSTRISMWPLMEALSEKGHNVTFLSPFKNPEDKSSSKVRSLIPKKLNEAMDSIWDNLNFFEIRKIPWGLVKSWYDFRDFSILTCELLYSDKEFLDWALSPETKVDLVIVEFSLNECAYGFVHLWKSKFIVYSTTTVLSSMYDAHGLPDETSAVSDFLFGFKTSSQNQMSFGQRLVNGLQPILYSLTREWFFLPRLEEITRNGLGLTKEELPGFREMEKNTSLVMLTTHYSFETARSLPPNVVAVGGTVVVKEKQPLPKEMADFINSAKDGFVYISFGTVTDFTHFDESIQLEFINALKALPNVKFIWKSTTKITVTKLPDNVFTASWVPQQTILAHPKIKAFITHAGMGSTTEAIHFSVPLICIPVMCDQDLNANAIEDRGAGIKLEVLTLKKEELQRSILEILHDKKYSLAMNKLTEIFKDRPRPPLEEAVWWIEYVMRHNNSHEFLTSPTAHQSWWKRRQIDVWLTVAAFLFIIISIPVLLIKKLFAQLFSLKQSKRFIKNTKKIN